MAVTLFIKFLDFLMVTLFSTSVDFGFSFGYGCENFIVVQFGQIGSVDSIFGYSFQLIFEVHFAGSIDHSLFDRAVVWNPRNERQFATIGT